MTENEQARPVANGSSQANADRVDNKYGPREEKSFPHLIIADFAGPDILIRTLMNEPPNEGKLRGRS